jgi:hypothetical protein
MSSTKVPCRCQTKPRDSTLLQEISSVDIPKASYAVAPLGAGTALQNQSFESTRVVRAWIDTVCDFRIGFCAITGQV